MEAVLSMVELVPPGTALAYGDVAELLGSGGPRQVGHAMSHYGSQVAWWRILKASGQGPEGHEADALRHYVQEGDAAARQPRGLPAHRRRQMAGRPDGGTLGTRRG